MSTLFILLLVAQALPPAQEAGRAVFEKTCAKCHGGDGKGGEMGPNIQSRLGSRSDAEMTRFIRNGSPNGAMPGVNVSDQDISPLLRYLRYLQRNAGTQPQVRLSAKLTTGAAIEGFIVNEGFNDVQLRGLDGSIHLLRRAGSRFRELTSERNWPGYDGDPRGNRYTPMTQIDRTNVNRLGPRWVFNIPNGGYLQGTPVVVGGIMYVTIANECWALDAGTGRQIWHFKRNTTRGPTDASGGSTNRGAAVAGSRVFMDTDEAHLIALDRFTGALLWETTLADWKQNYFTTSAPQVAGNLILSGVAGGEHGSRGFVAAFEQNSGKEVWRFWTVPLKGQPGSETWQGSDIDHGGASPWFTGTYDPELDVVYWPTGNPSKEYNGDQRLGDNLYANCVLALDRKTGKLKWHYQFTPHDLWDWDATQTSVLIDANWQGQPRKLMLHADRNGFFYVFDRTDGKLLLAKAFLRNITWAKGIGANGRPILNPGNEPTKEGIRVCPSQDGATNWFSPSYSPATGLYYFQTFEKCSIYTKREGDEWEAGKSYLGGTQRTGPDPKPQRVLKAVDIHTGAVKWEVAQPGPAQSWGGTLATASGLVIVGEESGALMAVDALNGKPLWSFQTNATWKASPMTYMFDGKQHIAVAAGPNILSFALPD